MRNPFIIGFGIKPEEYIPMLTQRREVESAFEAPSSKNRAYVISGVRGSGKTVLMSEIAKRMGPDWVVIDISSQDDLLSSLSSQLYSDRSMHKLFVKARIDLSFLGIGLHVEESSSPAFDHQTAITLMLEELQRHEKRLLVKIDEVANTASMRKFASVFQILISRELPIYLLMAGLPGNIRGLTDEKKSTFLLRTPKIEMPALNMTSVRRSYMKSLGVAEDVALYLAHLTKGYAFAYQVLGNLCWGKDIVRDSPDFSDILYEYDQYLQEYSYVKIWEELSETDKRVSRAIAGIGDPCKVSEAREKLSMDSGEFNVYRTRLIQSGLLKTTAHGEVSFALPRFSIFVKDQL